MACLVLVAVVSGCTSVIAGNVRPAPGLKPRPLTGETIKRVLLDDAALSRILDQPLTTKSDLPPRFGGPEKLQQNFGAVSPAECVGVTLMLAHGAYRSGPVKNVARETWWNAATQPATVIDVSEGVVALPTAADATALFATFSQQWDRCNGATVTISSGSVAFADQISDVRVVNSVLAATVSIQTRLAGSPTTGARPEARALGVRGNCLVEVEVAFFSTRNPSDQGTGDVNTSAIDIAHAMMDKVSALS